MKLVNRITYRLSAALLILFAVWGALFYFIMIEEINDEADDTLEDYSEVIISRKRRGIDMPGYGNGTNNQHYIMEVSEKYAEKYRKDRFSDEMVYIKEKEETEPARVLKTIFEDEDGLFYELTVSMPTIEKDDLKATILSWMIILYGVLLAAIVIINAIVSHNSLKPLYKLLGWLDGYRLGTPGVPLNNETSVTEFRKLNEAVKRNTERNEKMYEQQKEFISNASHELQTPLAVCRNRLEMLAEDNRLTEEQLEELGKTMQSVDGMIKLNKTLLLLTKIENGQFPEISEISVNRLAERTVEDYSEIFSYKNISCVLSETAEFTIEMNETLASVMISNLIKNAFFHTADNGEIIIDISSDSFIISNTSNGTPLDREKIFKRFYKKAGNEKSTGLGLSLSASVCARYGLTLEYSFEKNMHIFKIISKK